MLNNGRQSSGEMGTPILYRAEVVDLPELRRVATASYPPTLLPLCLETLTFHEQCLNFGIDDGRLLFKYLYDGQIIGGCGLHRYIWAPPSICWGSWFFIHPEYRSTKNARRMYYLLLREAVSRSFTRLYVETPAADRDYATLSRYLPRAGFSLEATLKGYYAPHVDQQIFRLDLPTEI